MACTLWHEMVWHGVPVKVEQPVSEPSQLGQQVEPEMEEPVESEKPDIPNIRVGSRVREIEIGVIKNYETKRHSMTLE